MLKTPPFSSIIQGDITGNVFIPGCFFVSGWMQVQRINVHLQCKCEHQPGFCSAPGWNPGVEHTVPTYREKLWYLNCIARDLKGLSHEK